MRVGCEDGVWEDEGWRLVRCGEGGMVVREILGGWDMECGCWKERRLAQVLKIGPVP